MGYPEVLGGEGHPSPSPVLCPHVLRSLQAHLLPLLRWQPRRHSHRGDRRAYVSCHMEGQLGQGEQGLDGSRPCMQAGRDRLNDSRGAPALVASVTWVTED